MVYVSAKKEQEFPAPFLNVVCQNKLSAVCLKCLMTVIFIGKNYTGSFAN